MPEPVTAADCRLLLSLLKFAIVDPAQRERVESWLEAKRDALDGRIGVAVSPTEIRLGA